MQTSDSGKLTSERRSEEYVLGGEAFTRVAHPRGVSGSGEHHVWNGEALEEGWEGEGEAEGEAEE